MHSYLLWIALAATLSVVSSAWIEKYKPDFYQLQVSPLKTSLIHDCSKVSKIFFPSYLSPSLITAAYDIGDSSYILDIQDITLTPPYPSPGDNLTIEAIGYLEEPVDYGAEAHVLVKLGFVQLLKRTFDICQEIDNNDVDLQCPIMDGLVKVMVYQHAL